MKEEYEAEVVSEESQVINEDIPCVSLEKKDTSFNAFIKDKDKDKSASYNTYIKEADTVPEQETPHEEANHEKVNLEKELYAEEMIQQEDMKQRDTSFKTYTQKEKVNKNTGGLAGCMIVLIKISIGLILLPFIVMIGGMLLGGLGLVFGGSIGLICGGLALLVGGAFFASSVGGSIFALMLSLASASLSLGLLLLLIFVGLIRGSFRYMRKCREERTASKLAREVNER